MLRECSGSPSSTPLMSVEASFRTLRLRTGGTQEWVEVEVEFVALEAVALWSEGKAEELFSDAMFSDGFEVGSVVCAIIPFWGILIQVEDRLRMR